ncbi:MAG: hypothetical protein ACREEM_30495 [Blastocatellia bacterium]
MSEAQPLHSPLSVVIGSHNARTSVRDCLSVLAPQCDEHGAELIVVDNSTDGTFEVVSAEFPRVKLSWRRLRR